jgi:membrane-associated phospholipid phosphatase
MLYHEARPTWVSLEVQPFYCSSQFGNPSGHTLMATTMIQSYLLNSFPLTGSNSKNYLGVLVWTIGYIYVGIIGYSRLFLGAHTLNQVVFGFLIGEWLVLSYFFLVQEPLKDHAKILLAGNPVEKRKNFLSVILMYLISLVTLSLVYFFVREIPVEDQYLEE